MKQIVQFLKERCPECDFEIRVSPMANTYGIIKCPYCEKEHSLGTWKSAGYETEEIDINPIPNAEHCGLICENGDAHIQMEGPDLELLENEAIKQGWQFKRSWLFGEKKWYCPNCVKKAPHG